MPDSTPVPVRMLDRVAGGALLLMLALMMAEIVARGAFEASLYVTEEVCSYLLAVLVFFGLPRVMLQDALIRVDVLHSRLSERYRLVVNLICFVVSIIIAAVFLYQIGRLVMSSYRRDIVTTSGLEIHIYLPQMIMIVGFLAIFCVLVLLTVRTLRRLAEIQQATRAKKPQ